MIAWGEGPRARARALLALASIGLCAAVILFARSRAEPPARCASGMIALGPRCCGEGQRLEADRCAGAPARCAPGMRATDSGCVFPARVIRIEGGLLRVGPGDWEAQGVVAPYQVNVPAFGLDAAEITEERWLACVAASACPPLPLTGEPGRALANVTAAEAARFCAWAGGALPTSDQLAFAAAGKSGRRYAWGDTGAVCRRAAWGLVSGPCGWRAIGPELGGAHPDGASPEGLRDLAGNVAEWATGPSGFEVRGGSYVDGAASALRSWQRRAVAADTRAPDIGFRCAYVRPPPAPAP